MMKNYVIIILLIIIKILLMFSKNDIFKDIVHINLLLDKFEKPSKMPIHDPSKYFWSEKLEKNYETILQEYNIYCNHHHPQLHSQINKSVADCDRKSKWKTVYLRVYGLDTNIACFFPKTMNLLKDSNCTLAFYSILEPGAVLYPHYGPYTGVLRYHLGLIIPDNKYKCFIRVENNVLHWDNGKSIMFDDTFIHYATNKTTENRLILFLDIKKDYQNPIINFINDFFIEHIKSDNVVDTMLVNINNLGSDEIKNIIK